MEQFLFVGLFGCVGSLLLRVGFLYGVLTAVASLAAEHEL